VAKDIETGTEVVLKFLPSALAAQQHALERIEQTVRNLSQRTGQRLERSDGRVFLVLHPPDVEGLLPHLQELTDSLKQPHSDDQAAEADTTAITAADPTQLMPTGAADARAEPGAEESTIAPARLLGTRYRIIRSLGRGGMGEVWHAFDLKLQVEVALKALRRKRFPDDESLELLRHEVRAGREVISPNVSRIYDLVEQEGQELLSMEYVDGQTLIEFLCERGPLDPSEAGRIASQFLAGLEAVHDAGLVHRDIKPENVMITRTGRVVVMDFGIAQPLATRDTDEVAGTLPYVAPEVLRGDACDARADLYAAAVVLAEMIAPDGVGDDAARKHVWDSVRETPPRLADCAWKAVLERALALDPEERFDSSRELALALEAVTPRVVGADDQEPYPGLGSVTSTEAEFFHGREAEVEALWKKLQRSQLLAVIGASGAGKTSFLQAGLITTRPDGWVHLHTHPGENPFMSLAQALAPEFTQDQGAVDALLRFEDANVALSLVHRWRARHTEALLIVDQFEELFTVCSAETRSRFTAFLGRVAMEADVRILLSMRDDFLIQCQEHPALAPILVNLTVLGPLRGNALRRALVQPALTCGYRFEDEELVEEILDSVRGERGALPLLAFAMSRLWEKRDRETGRLTREAYAELGRVDGALAQYAEVTLTRIGSHNEELVREIFRNLMTAQGTRASLTTDELLSVFRGTGEVAAEDREEKARAVLSALVDARLLTSYEDAPADSKPTQRRIEVVHESLFRSWPRLVRWRTQDAGSAQLRDQLRQAAQLWAERGCSRDLLWTGAAFRDYQAWRERYPGGLTATEEAFARAMTASAEQQRRRRRRLTAAVVVLLAGATTAFATLWQRQAAQTRRAEASRLLSQAALVLEDNTTLRFAYAIASLELHDDARARRFVMETLWRGPIGFTLQPRRGGSADFSPDGKWLTVWTQWGDPQGNALWSLQGSAPTELPAIPGGAVQHANQYAYFGPHPDRLITQWFSGNHKVVYRTVPSGKVMWTLNFPSSPRISVSQDRRYLTTRHGVDASTRQVQVWLLQNEEPDLVAARAVHAARAPGSFGLSLDAVDATGTWLASAKGNDIELARIRGSEIEPPRLIGRHDAPIYAVAFQPGHERVAAVDQSGEIRFWSITPQPDQPLRTMQGQPVIFGPARFDPSGSFLATPGGENSTVQIWDVDAPAGTEPIVFRSDGGAASGVAFHPEGTWLATAINRTRVCPLTQRYPRILRAHSTTVNGVVFAPDGSWIASLGQDRFARLWNLPGDTANRSWRIAKEQWIFGLSADPKGRFIVTCGKVEEDGTGIQVIPIDGGEIEVLPAPVGEMAMSVDVDPTGRFVAVGFTSEFSTATRASTTRVYDLETAEVRVLEVGEDQGVGVYDVKFKADGTLLVADVRALRQWNLDDGTNEVLFENVGRFDFSEDERYFVTKEGGLDAGRATVHDVETGKAIELTSHGRITALAFDRSGRRVVTGDNSGTLRVGSVNGEAPHLLPGHTDAIWAVAVHPNGEWIATAGEDGSVRMWPMPEGDPIHTLPHDELVKKLRTLTNVRIVPNETRPGEYKVALDPFPGWDNVPTWQR
jgi:WD40 repeat protein/tRNA A-37 threonylcarbamoyl transferase component Bud32